MFYEEDVQHFLLNLGFFYENLGKDYIENQ